MFKIYRTIPTRHSCLAGLVLSLLFLHGHAPAQEVVQAVESTITIPTYPLGPPDANPPFPLVSSAPVYPYPMLDDLSDKRTAKTYRTICLENQYLKITILPELGGHVYSMYDKLNHREVLYRNNVIKYGLVGPRGAWISGGMEFSFPFAHTTDTVSRVESVVHQNPDGSATAMIGAVDWVSNMYWEIALTLRPNTARLEEGVTLFNATPLTNLYLFWTNTAVRATDDMQYIYPMRETISDDPFAIVQSWPVWEGVDQSWYKNDPDALAIFARDVQRNFFGVYYHESDYGLVHVADFQQDPGKKVWTWGTAPSGRIWENILSDDDGPYNEIQSGRFATQGYREFMNPHQIEKWTEYWYPVAGLGDGFVEATSQMAVNATFSQSALEKPRSGNPTPEKMESGNAGQVKVLLSPTAGVKNARVVIRLGTKELRVFGGVNLVPLHPVTYTIPVEDIAIARKQLIVEVQSAEGTRLLHWSAAQPVDGNPGLTPLVGKTLQTKISVTSRTPIEELYLHGLFLQKKGDMQGALHIYEQVLQQDPGYTQALIQEALYHYRAANFAEAKHFIERARQRDDENPTLAYAEGLIYRANGQPDRAKDSFWKMIHYGSASSPGLSESMAYLQLGEIAIHQANFAEAISLLQHVIHEDSIDALALADLATAERMSGDMQGAAASSAKATQAMPLLPFALAERWLDQAPQTSHASHEDLERVLDSDPQNYLAVAAWYHDMGDWHSSDAVLQDSLAQSDARTPSPMTYYYLASNSRHEGKVQQAAQYAAKAASLPMDEIFPNRITDAVVLTEAVDDGPQDSFARFALGTFLFAHGRYDEAATLWSTALEHGFSSSVLLRDLAVYEWHVKSDLVKAASYYARAITLRPSDYRLYADLDQVYEAKGDTAARAKLFHDAPDEVLQRDTVLARHALFFIEQSQPDAALALLVDRRFKPWEGGVIIHNMFVFANLQKGKKALAEDKPAQAAAAFRIAMQYPENLGTGQPSQPKLAEQLYWLGVALEAEKKPAEAATAWQKAAEERAGVFSALALSRLGKKDLARQMLQQCIESARQPDSVANDYLAAGLAERYSGEAVRAHSDFNHALVLDPLLWQARMAAGEMNEPGISPLAAERSSR